MLYSISYYTTLFLVFTGSITRRFTSIFAVLTLRESAWPPAVDTSLILQGPFMLTFCGFHPIIYSPYKNDEELKKILVVVAMT
jgi:hypothetical protein